MNIHISRGFSIVEVLLASVIMVILLALGTPVTVDFYQSQLVTSERDNLVSILKRARTLSLANKNKSAHGVYIDNNQYLLFEGSSYASRNTAYDESFAHTSALIFSGVSEIVFAPLSADSASTSLIGNIGQKTLIISTNTEGGIVW
ncbi:MAG: prepilin-type N-terminal cleavage/methylation domain-containing protein [bacterium]|nr:prepilin-type N-terminal cleavage/methylation domain-containing protein [bacterium]